MDNNGIEVSNDALARILGRMEAKLDEQVNGVKRLEGSVAALEAKVTRRLDDQDERLRKLEVANPAEIAKKVEKHEERIKALENGAARSGAIAGIGSGLLVTAIVEYVKRTIGH